MHTSAMDRGDTYRGFTLIEMLVVLALIAILISLSTPLSNIYRQNRVSTNVQGFVGALNVARTEAVSRRVPVSICVPSRTTTNGVTTISCEPQVDDTTNWSNGWIVFTDTTGNGNCVFEPGNTPNADQIISEQSPMGDGFKFGFNSASCISYTPEGVVTATSTGVWTLCDPSRKTAFKRGIDISLSGRVQMLTPERAAALNIPLDSC